MFRIVNESTREPVENPATRVLREGRVVGLANHTLLIRKDGAELPIDDSAAPIRGGDGAVLGCVLVFRDISVRKASELALGEAWARLQRVVTDMAIPTMVYAEDGRVLLVNRAWTTITGYGADELTTLPEWTRRAYGARAAMMNTVIGALFALTESIDNGEREITTAAGEKRIWHFITAPLGRDELGRRMLVTNAIDVTERRRLDAAVVASEARMRLAMDAAGYGGWEWDRQSGEMIWSDKTRELLGIGPDEPVSFEQFQLHIHPDDRERRERAITAAWTSGVHGNEYRLVRPDGEVRWLSSRGRVIRGPDGSERMLGVIGDITEQKNLVAALQDADRRKDEFLATLAHELRNPLAPLRNSLSILQRSRARRDDLRQGGRRDGAPAEPAGATDRRPARRQPAQPRQAEPACRGDRPGGDRRARGRGMPAGSRARRPRARGQCPRRAGSALRRPRAAGAGVRQPDRQRLQVHRPTAAASSSSPGAKASRSWSRSRTTASASTAPKSTACSRCSPRSTTRSNARAAASASA